MLGGLSQSPIIADSQQWQWSSIDVLSNESTEASYQSFMAIDKENNIHLFWQDATDYDGSGTDIDIFYKILYNENQTWSTTNVISTESNTDSYSPGAAFDSLGNLYVIWSDSTDYDGNGVDTDIVYKTFNDKTQTWSDTEVISTESTSSSSRPIITMDNSDSIHVIWADYTDYLGSGVSWDIFYKQLDNSTQSWSTTSVVSTESTDSAVFPDAAIDSNGNFYVVWHDYTDFGDSGIDIDIFLKRLSSRSEEWGLTEVVSTESIDDSYQPSITVDVNDNIHLAWWDYSDFGGAGNDDDIFYKEWISSSQSWTTTRLVSYESTKNSRDPQIISDSEGVHIVWTDNTALNGADDTNLDIFYEYRALDATYWSSSTHVNTINSGMSTYPSLLIDNFQFLHMTWSDNTDYDNSGTDYDIFYSKLSGSPQTPILEEIVPNPNNGIINLEWSEVFSAVSYSIYRDIYPIHSIEGLTPIAETSDTYYVDEMDTGTYYYAITANNPEGSSLSNMVYVQVGMDIQTIINTDIVTETADGGFIDYPLSVPLLFSSLTLIIIVQRKRKLN